ncbi:hypothetical protein UPYG_G00206010 [Umbra pygmaea]|uniref:TIR domain-containing protein n=1 Tax=Umbra pygmaea TaxID=75934 RepID=A0ABD0X9M8_UMBPY
MQSSRRLLVVLSPDYLTEKSVSLLECRLGLYLQLNKNAHIITVLYRPLPRLPSSCAEAQQLRCSTSTINWRGRQSEPPASRFWKRLRLALPVRPLALGRRLIDSTSSHSDLAASLGLIRQQRNTAESQTKRQRKVSSGGGGKGRHWRIQEAQSRGQMAKNKEVGHSRYCRECVNMREPHGVMGRVTELTVKTLLHNQHLGDRNNPEIQPGFDPKSTETQLGLLINSTQVQLAFH